eukprot:11215909-Lingulodinium_polyedra.AAC.1
MAVIGRPLLGAPPRPARRPCRGRRTGLHLRSCCGSRGYPPAKSWLTHGHRVRTGRDLKRSRRWC